MNKKKYSFGEICLTVIGYIILLIAIVCALFPAVWMAISSVKPQSELFSIPPTFMVQNPTYDSYRRVIFETQIPRAFLNSVFIASATTFCAVIIGLLAGYGFARFRFRGNKVLSTALLFGQMMPAIVLLLPLYRIYSSIGFIDSYRVNILTDVATNMPMAVLTLTAFIRSIPRELDEAAMIDGTTRPRALFNIIAPAAMPGIVTVCIFTFLNTWEEFIYAFNFVNSSKYKTLAIAIKEFKGQFIIDWGGMMSAAMVISVPVLLIFLFCNKYFIKGLTSGAVKG